VVVAILALLVAVLLPSLQRAREQAKLVADQANCKQIGNITGEYQTEYKGRLPVLFNYHHAKDAPARCSYLSIAFRAYNSTTAHMNKIPAEAGGVFDPNEDWMKTGGDAKYEEYERRLLPSYYVCPFERGKGVGDIVKVGEDSGYTLWEYSGRIEYYHTWMWDGLVKGGRSGKVAHTSFTWNALVTNSNSVGSFPNGDPIPPKPGFVVYDQSTGKTPKEIIDIASNVHCQWDTAEVRRLRVASPSQGAVAWCARGEWTGYTQRYNVGSHRKAKGGTNAIFADSHVEWVVGTGIGWP